MVRLIVILVFVLVLSSVLTLIVAIVRTRKVPVRYNLRNIVERKGTTIMTAVGIALTVGVLVTTIAMTSGMAAVFAGSGHPRQALVMRDGANAELSSSTRPKDSSSRRLAQAK